jgi:N-acetylglucosamine kinase-like BadF-type ATPase
LDEAVKSILAANNQACDAAGVDLAGIRVMSAGLAGVQHPAHWRWMHEALGDALNKQESARMGRAVTRWRGEDLMLTTDADIALAGATDCQPGVVIISGTGSIAYGMNQAGEHARSGGWGPTLGDEGSGYDIGRRALSAAMAAYDGRLPETVLTRRICDYFQIESPTELPKVVYSDQREAIRLAPLSQLVEQAAREGDQVAQDILREAGEELARAVVAVIERLDMQQDSFLVCYVGSVFKAGDLILAPMRQIITEVAPRAELRQPLFPPAIGAVKLALKKIVVSSQ